MNQTHTLDFKLLRKSRSLDFKLVERVCLLQQALDQALNALDELKEQVEDKQLLESQLAETEKYANIQMLAISHLKQQLAQFSEVQNHLLDVIGFRLNELLEEQQSTYHQLNLKLQQSKTELNVYLEHVSEHGGSEIASESSPVTHDSEIRLARTMAANLSDQLNSAQKSLEHLASTLVDHKLNFDQIIQALQAMISDLTFSKVATDEPFELSPDVAESEETDEIQSQINEIQSETEALKRENLLALSDLGRAISEL